MEVERNATYLEKSSGHSYFSCYLFHSLFSSFDWVMDDLRASDTDEKLMQNFSPHPVLNCHRLCAR